MAKKLSSVLGIDIGSRKIKVAEVKAQGRDAVVTALAIVDTPEGAVDQTGVFNPDAVGAAIKQAISEAGASTGDVVVSISGSSSVLVRTLEVPRMNSNELKEHMQWEINRNIPFAESTVVSDFKPLGDDDPNSANMDVVLAISPQSAIDAVMDSVKKAGKKTHAIDVEPLGLARTLTTSYDDVFHDRTICVVEVGHKTTSINIYKNGKLLMPRQVPVGGENFTRAIADGLDVSMLEAEDLKLRNADVSGMAVAAGNFSPFAASAGGATQEFAPYNPFADEPMANPTAAESPMLPPDPEPDAAASAAPVVATDAEANRVNTALASELDEFVAEIRRSIDYFRNRGGDVDQIVLAGGGSQLRGLAEFLGNALSISCDSLDPLRRLNVNAKRADMAFVDAHRTEFTVAVGNGLHILFD